MSLSHRDLWSLPFLVLRHPSKAPEACFPRVSRAKARAGVPVVPAHGQNPARCRCDPALQPGAGGLRWGPSPCQEA